MMGQDLKALNESGTPTRGLVKPDWADSYTFRFMTYPERNYEYFDVSRHVPIRPPESTEGSDFLYILGDSYKPLVSVLQSYYPHGVYTEVHHPLTNELLYWTFHVSAADAAKAGNLSTGLAARYYVDVPTDRDHPEKGPHWGPTMLSFSRVDPFILFDWSVAPISGWYSVEWDGFLKAPSSGEYQFEMVSNSYGLLEIDGKKVAERLFLPPGDDSRLGKVRLSAGRHRIRLRYFEARNYSRFELWWTPPKGGKEVIPSTAFSIH
jgi:PA14 domain